jgi:Mrp family chromosome partitioning ATPase
MTNDSNNTSQHADDKTDFRVFLHEMSHVKKVIAIVSGKGGVGKSMVTAMLAVTARRLGYHTAIIDADITGPSIPKMFGIKQHAQQNEFGIFPVSTTTNIKIMSMNLFTDHETDPIVWRGPLIAKTVQQFWTDVIWDDIDCLFIDLPPGTGDVPLSVFQSLPVDGIIIVSSPQELVSMIVTKSVRMAKLMNIPILGIVENYAYVLCPSCHERHSVFGESHIDEIAKDQGIEILAKIPLDPQFAAACDRGTIESIDNDYFESLIQRILTSRSK